MRAHMHRSVTQQGGSTYTRPHPVSQQEPTFKIRQKQKAQASLPLAHLSCCRRPMQMLHEKRLWRSEISRRLPMFVMAAASELLAHAMHSAFVCTFMNSLDRPQTAAASLVPLPTARPSPLQLCSVRTRRPSLAWRTSASSGRALLKWNNAHSTLDSITDPKLLSHAESPSFGCRAGAFCQR